MALSFLGVGAIFSSLVLTPRVSPSRNGEGLGKGSAEDGGDAGGDEESE